MLKTKIKTAVLAVFLCAAGLLGGCSVVETVGDYLNANPVFANIATRQAVGRYIAAGETIEDERERANQVQKRISKVLEYVDGNPTTSIDNLMLVIKSVIDWDELTPADRYLVEDIVSLVEQELKKSIPRQQELSESSALAIKTLFRVAISAAEIYIRR